MPKIADPIPPASSLAEIIATAVETNRKLCELHNWARNIKGKPPIKFDRGDTNAIILLEGYQEETISICVNGQPENRTFLTKTDAIES